MRVAITGASGFVGRAVAARMQAAGHQVTALVRAGAAPDGAREVRIAGLDDPALGDALAGTEVVVHLAARVHVMRDTSADPLAEFRRVNVTGSELVYRAAAAAGARRLVYLSSVKVHGEGRDTPYVESDAPAPRDAYGRSKLEAEERLQELRAAGGACEVVALRPPLVYGPGVGGNFRRLLWLADRARRWPVPLGGLGNRRSLVSLANLADAIGFVSAREGVDGRALLVSDGEDLSTSQLLEALAHGMGGRARLLPCPERLLRLVATLAGRAADVDRLVGSLRVDSRMLRRDLGWTPPQSVASALTEVARWWRGVATA